MTRGDVFIIILLLLLPSMYHLKLKRNSRFMLRKRGLPRHHTIHRLSTLSCQLLWCFTNDILKKGPITPWSTFTTSHQVFSCFRNHTLKKGQSSHDANRCGCLWRAIVMNRKYIQVYAPHISKCLHAIIETRKGKLVWKQGRTDRSTYLCWEICYTRTHSSLPGIKM